MGTWVAVRGWIELNEGTLPETYRVIEESLGDAPRFETTADVAEQYNAGWVLPTPVESMKYWTHYAFFGHDVRIQYLPFLRHQMEMIAQVSFTDEHGYTEHPFGYIHVDCNDADLSEGWQLKDGQLHVFPGQGAGYPTWPADEL